MASELGKFHDVDILWEVLLKIQDFATIQRIARVNKTWHGVVLRLVQLPRVQRILNQAATLHLLEETIAWSRPISRSLQFLLERRVKFLSVLPNLIPHGMAVSSRYGCDAEKFYFHLGKLRKVIFRDTRLPPPIGGHLVRAYTMYTSMHIQFYPTFIVQVYQEDGKIIRRFTSSYLMNYHYDDKAHVRYYKKPTQEYQDYYNYFTAQYRELLELAEPAEAKKEKTTTR
jgi:hypothetical protein